MMASMDIQGEGAKGRGLPLVPALKEGASKRAVEQGKHQPRRRRFPVNLDRLGFEGEDREDVAVLPMARGRPGTDVTGRPGVILELKGALREPCAGLIDGAGRKHGFVAWNI